MGKGWGCMVCIVKRTNYHLGRRLHSLADRILVSTRILLIRTPPARSRFSLVEIARLGGPGLTLIASELKPTVIAWNLSLYDAQFAILLHIKISS